MSLRKKLQKLENQNLTSDLTDSIETDAGNSSIAEKSKSHVSLI